MALLEADGARLPDAKNVLGAIVNRAQKEGVDIGQHVSGAIYQPTIEPAQQARLARIIATPEFQQLDALAQRRLAGQEADWVQGATHFLAPEKTMLALEAQNPAKYRNWGPNGQNWTGYDPATGSYKGVVMRDASHAFLIPGGQTTAAAPQSASGEAAPAAPAPAAPQVAAAPQTPATAQTGGLLSGILGGLSLPEQPDQQQAQQMQQMAQDAMKQAQSSQQQPDMVPPPLRPVNYRSRWALGRAATGRA